MTMEFDRRDGQLKSDGHQSSEASGQVFPEPVE